MIIKGLISLGYHLAAVGIGWVVAMILIAVVKYYVLKSMNLLELGENAERKAIEKVAGMWRIVATCTAIVVALLFVFLIFNPTERPPEEIQTIPEALVDETYVPPTEEEISKSNEERLKAQHEPREKEAEEDNTKAMNDAINLFRKAAE
jgi:nitrogen fixation/metabolism regulation signal transduction histidine kinase